jgi:hypothetical protein
MLKMVPINDPKFQFLSLCIDLVCITLVVEQFEEENSKQYLHEMSHFSALTYYI